MTETDVSTGVFWMVTFILGLGTYAFRISFIQLQEWIDHLPPRLETAVALIPPAILAALISPEVFLIEEGAIGMFVNVRVVAGGLAFVVAWRTGSMLATIGVGMTVLWTAHFLVG